jgi:hypothetical protein
MQMLLTVLGWIALLYVGGLAAILIVSLWVVRQRLRKYQENGRFGY